jgi:hypothetical protein
MYVVSRGTFNIVYTTMLHVTMYAVILQEGIVVSSDIFAVCLHCLYLKYHNYSAEVSRFAGIQAMRMVQLVQDVIMQLRLLLCPE